MCTFYKGFVSDAVLKIGELILSKMSILRNVPMRYIISDFKLVDSSEKRNGRQYI